MEEGITRLPRCYRQLDECGGRLDLLSEPCRTAVGVDTALAIIMNGGFQYFFEMDFPDNPENGIFADAFRRVGLEDIADRFAALVALFPFDAPHNLT